MKRRLDGHFTASWSTRGFFAISYPWRSWTQPGCFAYRRRWWSDDKLAEAALNYVDDDYCCGGRGETFAGWMFGRRWWSADFRCIADNTNEYQSQDSSLSVPTDPIYWGRELWRCFEMLCCWLSCRKCSSILLSDLFFWKLLK